MVLQREDGTKRSPTLSMDREEVLKWYGWGYKDSKFVFREDDSVMLTGTRYEHSSLPMPNFKAWFQHRMGIDFEKKTVVPDQPDVSRIPDPKLNPEFTQALSNASIKYSTDPKYRLFRAHGHALPEIWNLIHGGIQKVPDIIVWPGSTSDVEQIVQIALKYDVVLMPYGGGTNVTMALACDPNEQRTIASIDMCMMNKILWIDEMNMTAEIEAGMVGQDIEKELNNRGFSIGHEPDSVEFSTLGGWISTRASGMRKNIYGNIEDIVVHVTIVTPRGVMRKSSMGPRMSTGPDINNFILGSEGMFGVITSAIVKIRPLPECKHYGSIVFPDFESGVKCLREIARRRCAPASIRLMDNEQFMMGQALRVGHPSWIQNLTDFAKKVYLQSFQGYHLDKMCAATLLFEGSNAEVSSQEKLTYAIAKKFGGIAAGEENGRIGYLLTFMIAYLRDIGLEYNVVGESFETSVPWDRVLLLCRNTIERIKKEASQKGVKHPCLATCRVTQTYDAGACVYFYFAFNYEGLSDPVGVYEEIEGSARDEVMACGGSLSHHHGVGKIRKKWMNAAIGEIGVGSILALKRYLDPTNIFAANNLISVKEEAAAESLMDIKL